MLPTNFPIFFCQPAYFWINLKKLWSDSWYLNIGDTKTTCPFLAEMITICTKPNVWWPYSTQVSRLQPTLAMSVLPPLPRRRPVVMRSVRQDRGIIPPLGIGRVELLVPQSSPPTETSWQEVGVARQKKSSTCLPLWETRVDPLLIHCWSFSRVPWFLNNPK